MDDLGNFHITSLPQSIGDMDNLSSTQSQASVPPVPYPRKGSSPCFATSGSKQQVNHYSSCSRKSQCSPAGSNYSRNGNGKNIRVHRAASLEYPSNCDIKISPIANIPCNSDPDTEDEDNNNHVTSNERLSSNIRSKKSHQRYASRSLPVTPRVSGSCSVTQGPTISNGLSSPFVSSIGGTSTPLLAAPHLAPHLSLEGSFNSIGSLSPSSSQYVTCTSGLMSDTQDKLLPGSIDYSSLPLPREDCFRGTARRNISRHMSEPCIHEIPNSHLSAAGKCHSCPQRKSSLRYRKRDMQQLGIESELCGGNFLINSLRNSSGEIESKTEDLDGVEMQWQFIRTLVDELNKARSQNNRMAVELHQAKLEIQMLKAPLDSYKESGVQPGVVAEMVRQIHVAQKLRDEAMMSRIKLANEERDAALAQTRSLLEKFGLSPRAPLDHITILNMRDHVGFSTPLSRNDECINISSLEDELKALKFAINIQDTLQEKLHLKENCFARGEEGQSQELYDELKSKLNESETSRVQLQDRCSKLERVFSSLRRKVNGLNSLESSNVNPASLTFFDMTLFGSHEAGTGSDGASLTSQDTNASQNMKMNSSSSASSKVSQGEGCPKLERPCHSNVGTNDSYPNLGTSSEELKDSSLDSVETASSSSWKQVNVNRDQQQGSGQHVSMYDSSSSQSHSTLTPPSPHSPHSKIVQVTSDRPTERRILCKNETCADKESCIPYQMMCMEGCNSDADKNEFKPRNLGGVSIMGPITEL